MDRFIAQSRKSNRNRAENLKSNMDRFIAADKICNSCSTHAFKIQYG